MVFMDIGHQQYNINTILKIPSLNWFFSAGSVPLLQELTSQGTEKLLKNHGIAEIQLSTKNQNLY